MIEERFKQNIAISVFPKIVYLPFTSTLKPLQTRIRIINQSHEKIRIHCKLAKPDPNLKLRRVLGEVLYPGGYEDLELTLAVHSWDQYSNQVLIKTHKGEVMPVSIFAYPVMEDLVFPANLSLGGVIISQEKKVTIPLRSLVPVDFDFRIAVIEKQPSSCWRIYPLEGCLKGNSELDLNIEFLPTQLQTCQLKFELVLTQFNFRPRICRVFGTGVLPDQKQLFKKELGDLGLDERALKSGKPLLNKHTKTTPKLKKPANHSIERVRLPRLDGSASGSASDQRIADSADTESLSAAVPPAAEAGDVFAYKPTVTKTISLSAQGKTTLQLPPPIWHNTYPLQDRFVRLVWSLIVYRRIKTRVQILKRAYLLSQSDEPHTQSLPLEQTVSNTPNKTSLPLKQTVSNSSHTRDSQLSQYAKRDFSDRIPRSWGEFQAELAKAYPTETNDIFSALTAPTGAETADFELPPLSKLQAIQDNVNVADAVWVAPPRLNYLYELDIDHASGDTATERKYRPFRSVPHKPEEQRLSEQQETEPAAYVLSLEKAGQAPRHSTALQAALPSFPPLSVVASTALIETEDSQEFILEAVPQQALFSDLRAYMEARTNSLSNSLSFMSENWKIFSAK